jgi:hypothetical protein
VQQVDLNLVARQRDSVFRQFLVCDLHLPGGEVADADRADPAGFDQPCHGPHLGADRRSSPG